MAQKYLLRLAEIKVGSHFHRAPCEKEIITFTVFKDKENTIIKSYNGFFTFFNEISIRQSLISDTLIGITAINQIYAVLCTDLSSYCGLLCH